MNKVYVVVEQSFDAERNVTDSFVAGVFNTEDAAKKYCESILVVYSVNYDSTARVLGDVYKSVRADGSYDRYTIEEFSVH